MNKIYLFFLLVGNTFLGYSQYFQKETIGNPLSPTVVSDYKGWVNQYINFTGDAEVQKINPSDDLFASGLGNIFFNNIPGMYFQISGFEDIHPDEMEMFFGLFGYDTSNPTSLDDLVLSVSLDSGVTWSALPYHRLFNGLFPPHPWDVFEASFPGSPIEVNKLFFRFTQTSSMKTFRIDDINIKFYYLLPIKLKDFTVSTTSLKTILKWNAVTNSNKEIFVVEKSYDGINFSTIEQQHAKGGGQYSYEFVDQLYSIQIFYRLKLLDIDGKSSFSKILSVPIKKENTELIQLIYPVPAKNVLHIQINNDVQRSIDVSITDTKGIEVIRKNFIAVEGSSYQQINIESLKAGIYYLIVATTQKKEIRKIFVAP